MSLCRLKCMEWATPSLTHVKVPQAFCSLPQNSHQKQATQAFDLWDEHAEQKRSIWVGVSFFFSGKDTGTSLITK